MTIHEAKLASVGLTVPEAAKVAGIGRSTVYEELASGRLKARKLGRRTIILDADLRAWLAALPPMKSAQV